MSKTMWLLLGGLALWWYESQQAAATAPAATIPYSGNALVDYGCEIYPGSLAPQATVKSPGALTAPNLVSALEAQGYAGSVACQIASSPGTVPRPVYRAVREAIDSGQINFGGGGRSAAHLFPDPTSYLTTMNVS